jgi:hypothetical protein
VPLLSRFCAAVEPLLTRFIKEADKQHINSFFEPGKKVVTPVPTWGLWGGRAGQSLPFRYVLPECHQGS